MQVSIINIGPVHKKDVIKCSTMLERAKEFAVMLCFDVKIEKEAQELAEEFGVRIFKADIIYHLFDQFTAYNKVRNAKAYFRILLSKKGKTRLHKPYSLAYSKSFLDAFSTREIPLFWE